jgi:dihydroorotate dehydrogenase electron transfer subunit
VIDQDTKIVFNRKVALKTFLMGLKSADIAAHASPGQFVMVRTGHGMDPLLRRPFSLCGIKKDDLFLILYRVVGRGTERMSRMREGEKVSVLGPLGKGFELPEPRSLSILVAGGIGIAPLIFLAQAARNNMIFLTGYRSISEIVPLGQLGLTRVEPSIATDDGTAGYSGLVTELLESHLTESVEEPDEIFACGPIQMLKRIQALTMEHEITCSVSLEANMACGLGACQGCAIRALKNRHKIYQHVCADGPVFDVHTLDWESL